MATASVAAKGRIKEIVFEWEGKDKNGKPVRGEMRAGGEAMVSASLRRQGVMVSKVKKRRMSGSKAIKQGTSPSSLASLSTMMRAGVPLIQSFDIVARGSTGSEDDARPSPDIQLRRRDRHQPLRPRYLRQHPLYFDALYCNLVEAGEAGGILETLLDRLAIYQEKTMAIKNKIKSALIYPVAVLDRGPFVVLAVIMIFVIPAFEDVFKSFGADLPAPTLVVISRCRQFFTTYYWYLIFARHPVAATSRPAFMQSLAAVGEDAEVLWTGCSCASRRSSAIAGQQISRSPATRARSRRCSQQACRWSKRLRLGSAGPIGQRAVCRRGDREDPEEGRLDRLGADGTSMQATGQCSR